VSTEIEFTSDSIPGEEEIAVIREELAEVLGVPISLVEVGIAKIVAKGSGAFSLSLAVSIHSSDPAVAASAHEGLQEESFSNDLLDNLHGRDMTSFSEAHVKSVQMNSKQTDSKQEKEVPMSYFVYAGSGAGFVVICLLVFIAYTKRTQQAQARRRSTARSYSQSMFFACPGTIEGNAPRYSQSQLFLADNQDSSSTDAYPSVENPLMKARESVTNPLYYV